MRSAAARLAGLLFAGAVLVLAQRAQAQVRLDVPYVPTPPSVVEGMLNLADVRPGERVVDLGCGDGRVVVSAASRFGARGLGVDIDPQRIREARANAVRAGVEERVEFRLGDLFEVDLSDADVLAIYLLDDVNLRLRPTILRQMRPGTRVVSHAFGMGNWRPDRHETIDGNSVYLWIVPADVEGRWHMERSGRGVELSLRQYFSELSGTATVDGRAVPLHEGRVRGAEVEFAFELDAGTVERFRGRVDGGRIVAQADDDPFWEAERAP
ncbi:SAM-dependent methyltransferase [Pseudothauera rhizosphaerae]|uniref:Methyltransferase domain-containing protein n=1 Tax=Pseudothauera rhizosphaerae TaxID=2565932 RepID=A0A4S4AM38_9RHOO|nr:methyltransferase domain-containing protein [Pseudothauera rhizosphaerae]THF60651.1 methyltransferase domain-containing protein [Pseudothauera rhizosphaerae]